MSKNAYVSLIIGNPSIGKPIAEQIATQTALPLIIASGSSRHKIKITAELSEGVAHIRITDVITDWIESKTSSSYIREKIDKFQSDGIKTCKVYINSMGGNCWEATEIANELERFEEVEFIVGALAASAATYLIAKFPSYAKNSSSQFMIHRPRLFSSGDIESIKNDLKMLENMTEDYRKTYAKKMGISEEEVDELWGKGDKWLTAQEALDLKLIDGILSENQEQITEEDIAVLTACGAPVIPKLTAKNTDTNTQIMDKKLIIALLGLSADATDEQVELAVRESKRLADLQKANQLTAQASIDASATALVDKAIADKKITAESRDFYIGVAKNDLEGTKTEFERMPGVTKLTAQLEGNQNPSGVPTPEARADWSYDKWAEEDPKGLEAMYTTEPEKFNKLFNASK